MPSANNCAVHVDPFCSLLGSGGIDEVQLWKLQPNDLCGALVFSSSAAGVSHCEAAGQYRLSIDSVIYGAVCPVGSLVLVKGMFLM